MYQLEVYHLNYYICDKCKFQFTRMDETDRCPDCGKETVRKANADEIEEFKRIQKELAQEHQ